MAGEDYTSPITGLTYKVPMYEEPADAPVAFKDFADSITVGGPATREDAVLQALSGDQGLTWQEGMALSVVEELPDDSVGEIGDVVFVLGDVPKAGGGGLEGVGDWAEITAMTGDPKRYDYTADGVEWAAFEWTADGELTTTQGLIDGLVVGAGGLAPSGWISGSGGGMVFHGVVELSGSYAVTIGKPSNNYSSQSRIAEQATGKMIITCPCGQSTGGVGPYGYTGQGGTGSSVSGAGAGAGGDAPNTATGGPGVTVAYKSVTPIEYGRGGDASSGVGPVNTGQGGQNGKAADGVVIVRVPKDKVTATGGWV